MSVKGTVDPAYIDRGTSNMMGGRGGGGPVDPGWWGVDDDFNPVVGPYVSREACQHACDAFNASQT